MAIVMRVVTHIYCGEHAFAVRDQSVQIPNGVKVELDPDLPPDDVEFYDENEDRVVESFTLVEGKLKRNEPENPYLANAKVVS
jgi:hypothetical protein